MLVMTGGDYGCNPDLSPECGKVRNRPVEDGEGAVYNLPSWLSVSADGLAHANCCVSEFRLEFWARAIFNYRQQMHVN